MTFEQTIFAIVAGVGGALVTAGVGAWASRKFGLPGVARMVDAEQDKLIATLRENNQHLSENNSELRQQNTGFKTTNGRLIEENRDLRYKLREAYDDIATLYRSIKQPVPEHVLTNRDELAATEGPA